MLLFRGGVTFFQCAVSGDTGSSRGGVGSDVIVIILKKKVRVVGC
jgi:hypothetical protein